MVIDKNIIENLCDDAGENRTKRANDYKKEGRVDIIEYEYKNPYNFEIKGNVYGNEKYNTYICVEDGEVQDVTCTCPDYYNYYSVCKHTLAMVLEFEEEKSLAKKKTMETDLKVSPGYDKYRGFKQIVNTFYHDEIEEIEEEETKLKEQGEIKLEPEVFYDKFSGDMKVEFKIGNKRMYKIKSLSEFYTRMLNKELYKYGQKLQYQHLNQCISFLYAYHIFCHLNQQT